MDNLFRPTEYHSIIAKTSENNKHFAAILRKRENFILCISVWTGCENIGGKVDNLHAREKNGRSGRKKDARRKLIHAFIHIVEKVILFSTCLLRNAQLTKFKTRIIIKIC